MQNVDVIAWDLDGTKYKFHDDIYDTANNVLYEVVTRKLVDAGRKPLPREDVFALGQQSYQEYGLSWMIFAEKFDLDAYELFSEFNINMPMETVDSEASPTYKARMRQTKQMGVDHIIFTHGSRAWARKVLGKIDLSEEFNDSSIFDVSHTQWTLKQNGRAAYDKLQGLYEFNPDRSLMVEDTARCLLGAKEIGMTTVFIDRAGKLAEKPDYIDHVYPDPEAFLADFIAHRNKPTLG